MKQAVNSGPFTGKLKSAVSLFLLTVACLASSVWAQSLKVGVYQNPPSVFYDGAGKVQGFYIDVIEHIAEAEDWQLQYVKATWPELLDKLNNGEIDLIAGMAFSAERDLNFDFTAEPVFINWGRVYVRDTSIQSLLDLTNRRVAGLKDDIYTLQFEKLLDQFGLPVKLIEVSSYEDVMRYVESGRADAGITSRSNGHRLEGLFDVHRSPIVCCSREVHYAAKENSFADVLRTIDHHLQELKSRNNSEYFASLDHWFAEKKDEIIPTWLLWLLAGSIAALALLGVLSLILRRQVRERTVRLQDAYAMMESRVDERTQELSERNQQLLKEIYEHRKTQEKLQYMVRHDPLTGLPNRRWFSEQLTLDLKMARRDYDMLAVMFLDLDGFKQTNDTYGHDYGDLVLVSAAERVKDCLRESDKISRLGGDEFIVILPKVGSVDAVKVVAQKVLDRFGTPFMFEGVSCEIGVSIGISLFPDHSDNAEMLLTYADQAMYDAKKNGRNRYSIFKKPKKPRLEIV